MRIRDSIRKWRIFSYTRKYDKLIISLRTAQANELSLDKDHTVHDDLLDALRLSLKGYVIGRW